MKYRGGKNPGGRMMGYTPMETWIAITMRRRGARIKEISRALDGWMNYTRSPQAITRFLWKHNVYTQYHRGKSKPCRNSSSSTARLDQAKTPQQPSSSICSDLPIAPQSKTNSPHP